MSIDRVPDSGNENHEVVVPQGSSVNSQELEVVLRGIESDLNRSGMQINLIRIKNAVLQRLLELGIALSDTEQIAKIALSVHSKTTNVL